MNDVQIGVFIAAVLVPVGSVLILRQAIRKQQAKHMPKPVLQKPAADDSDPGYSRKITHLKEIETSFQITFGQKPVPIKFSFTSSTYLLEISVHLKMKNTSAYPITINRIGWEMWMGLPVKCGSLVEHTVLAPNESREVILRDNLNETETRYVSISAKESRVDCYFEAYMNATTDFGRVTSKFSACNVPFAFHGEEGPMSTYLLRKTHVDPLTGLLQRTFLDDNLQTIIDGVTDTRPVSLLMIDVDDFKRINDTYGHLIGDDVLKAVCGQIRMVAGELSFCIRYGGDEFSVVLKDYHSEEAKNIAETIRSRIALSPLKIPSDETLYITVSIGVATVGEPTPYRELIQKADDVLRLSKQEGKNRVTVASS